jgi:hypothetical protein
MDLTMASGGNTKYPFAHVIFVRVGLRLEQFILLNTNLNLKRGFRKNIGNWRFT